MASVLRFVKQGALKSFLMSVILLQSTLLLYIFIYQRNLKIFLYTSLVKSKQRCPPVHEFTNLAIPLRTPKKCVVTEKGNLVEFKLKFVSKTFTPEVEKKLGLLVKYLQRSPVPDLTQLTTSLSWDPSSGTKEPHPWYLRPDKLQALLDNPLYENFEVEKLPQKEYVDLLLIVSTSPTRPGRRDGIRETWWPFCKTNARLSIKCVFITDYCDPNTTSGKLLEEEKRKYGDIFFQHVEPGFQFHKRFIYHMLWAETNYDYSYLLRMDDDILLCLDKLMAEIPMPPKTNYHWGHVHCEGQDLVWPDECLMIFSRDIILTFLDQDPHKMLCHPHADQMIAIWKDQDKLDFDFNSDSRIHHHPPSSHVAKFQSENDTCKNYIALHGTYAKDIRKFWSKRGTDYLSEGKSLLNYTHTCGPNKRFGWEFISNGYFYIPKLCINNPTWEISGVQKPGETFVGREGHK